MSHRHCDPRVAGKVAYWHVLHERGIQRDVTLPSGTHIRPDGRCSDGQSGRHYVVRLLKMRFRCLIKRIRIF
jgi:hypothetical protein